MVFNLDESYGAGMRKIKQLIKQHGIQEMGCVLNLLLFNEMQMSHETTWRSHTITWFWDLMKVLKITLKRRPLAKNCLTFN